MIARWVTPERTACPWSGPEESGGMTNIVTFPGLGLEFPTLTGWPSRCLAAVY